MYIIILATLAVFSALSYAQAENAFNSKTELTNIAFHNSEIFVGAVDYLYRLNANLVQIKAKKIGPKNTSKTCAAGDSACQRQILLHNKNTVLLVFTHNSKSELLTCGSINQGTCQLRSISNLNVTFDFSRYVAANNINASTVAYISKGPLINNQNIDILNIAVTRTSHVDGVDMPAVTARRMDVLNERKFLDTYTRIVVQVKDYTSFPIDYKSGFSYNGFSYFTAVQPTAVGADTYHSSIIRYCQKDITFSTYTEIPIACKDPSGFNYNILIAGAVIKATGKSAVILNVTDGEELYFGVFSRSAAKGKMQTNQNAICIYSMADINKAFEANIRQCILHGEPSDGGMPWAKSTSAIGCKEAKADYQIRQANTDTTIKLDLSCENLPFLRNFIQGGRIPLNATRSFTISGKPTSINGYPHARGFALFLGNADGSLRKYSLLPSMKTHLYGKESVTQNGRIKKIEIGPNKNFLYVLSSKKIVKEPIKDCGKRKSCVDCLAGPHCGWCTLENKCCMKSDCKNAQSPQRFVDDTATKCPKLLSVDPSPAIAAVKIETKIKWTIENLPSLQGSSDVYRCSFGGKLVTATVFGNEYSCATPKFGEVPGTDNIESKIVKVVLQSTLDIANLFEIDVDFYNCEKIPSCLKCTKFKYKCDWCSSSLTCLDSVTSCSGAVKHAGPDQTTKLSKCPRVAAVGTKYISNGVGREIVLFGVNYPASTAVNKYRCKVNIQGQSFTSTAKRMDKKTVICDRNTYTFSGKSANHTAMVSVLFGNKPLDAPENTKVTIYKCEVKRDDCSVCLDAPKTWQCGWCDQKHCTVSDACNKKWMNVSCPSPPRIEMFSPVSGAVYGNTELKIEGRDLGTAKGDIGNITVAGKLCEFLPNLYVQSKIIYCKTMAVPKPITGPVQVDVKFGDAMMKIKSTKFFMYKKPMMSNFEPKKGPCSGGTLMSLYGDNLDIGANVKVTVTGKACIVNNRQPSKITCTITSRCTTRKRRALSSNGVVVTFDGKTLLDTIPATFAFKPDPVISSINTHKLRTADTKTLETFVSGGQVFIIKGERLDLIQNPRMIFTILKQSESRNGPCVILNEEKMHCIAPNITDVTGMINKSIAVELGFLMQNVVALRSVRNITVTPDPVFEKFFQVRELTSNILELKGRNLDLLGIEDVNITVSNLPCVVQNIREKLLCTAPNRTMILKAKKEERGLVKVRIGEGGLQYTLGYVRYATNKSPVQKFPWQYVYIAGAVVAVFIIIIIVLVILYRRRQQKEKKYQKVYQTRLDNLESRYARECKEAFAELQTEMTDLTTDMSASTIPYLKFEDYAMRLLFPGQEDHPVMEKDCNKSDSWKRCMSSLCELLKEKEFLLILVKTLEAQNSFAMRDRCKVASLLMVALQDDLKYVTDILQELLSDLIEKSVDAGRGKLLLRRTESVAEKLLTNWLSYTLHEFLQQRVGEPLFRLFSAIGSLLDKEPVDCITCEARNSLSEDRLLRQKVDFQSITANVEYDSDDMIQVQLLDCDSINQAKEKILNFIYKNVPYSQRPSKESLVLVYLTPSGGEKILNQEDSTCETEGEWKRVNTLEHFLIPDGCHLKLVPFTLYSDGTGTPGRLDVFHDTSVPNVTFVPAHSSTPMLNSHHHHHSDSDYKMWHLVKSSDYPIEQKEDVRQNKMMAEVYLTRLLKTKGTLQNFVDELFDSVFSVTKRGVIIPPSMKFLFDFLDKQAALLGITDAEVLHTWKNNSLPLKFWINIVKNPNFVFDIHKKNIVDSCLSVTAQLFMDSCSPDEHRLGKDSPSNKLLYAKEIPDYKKKVARFYSDVKSLPPATDKELNESFADISHKYGSLFNYYNSASEILTYAVKYKVKIMDALENEDLEEYANKLQDIMVSLPDE